MESYMEREGVGNCTICTPHKDNKNCRLYCPITIMTYTVKDKEDV